jgi:hypothetical protein
MSCENCPCDECEAERAAEAAREARHKWEREHPIHGPKTEIQLALEERNRKVAERFIKRAFVRPLLPGGLE